MSIALITGKMKQMEYENIKKETENYSNSVRNSNANTTNTLGPLRIPRTRWDYKLKRFVEEEECECSDEKQLVFDMKKIKDVSSGTAFLRCLKRLEEKE